MERSLSKWPERFYLCYENMEQRGLRSQESGARVQGPALPRLACVDTVRFCLFLLGVLACQSHCWHLLDSVYLRLPACGIRLGQHTGQDEILRKSVFPESVAESRGIILQLIWLLGGITPTPIHYLSPPRLSSYSLWS